MTHKISLMNHYSTTRDSYLSQALDLYLNQGVRPGRIAKIIPVNKATIYRWIANFADVNPQVEPSVMARKSQKEEQTHTNVSVNEALPEDVLALQKEIKQLRAQLTKAEIKAEAFDELINVAEAQFGIQIRKKAGAKQ